jgi:hypothetical protein
LNMFGHVSIVNAENCVKVIDKSRVCAQSLRIDDVLVESSIERVMETRHML